MPCTEDLIQITESDIVDVDHICRLMINRDPKDLSTREIRKLVSDYYYYVSHGMAMVVQDIAKIF